MKYKYFHSAVANELPEGIRAYVITLPTLQSLTLKMKQAGDNITWHQMIYFHLINQSYEKNITFVKRQTIVALIILNEKANKNFGMEIGNALAEGSKKKI